MGRYCQIIVQKRKREVNANKLQISICTGAIDEKDGWSMFDQKLSD